MAVAATAAGDRQACAGQRCAGGAAGVLPVRRTVGQQGRAARSARQVPCQKGKAPARSKGPLRGAQEARGSAAALQGAVHQGGRTAAWGDVGPSCRWWCSLILRPAAPRVTAADVATCAPPFAHGLPALRDGNANGSFDTGQLLSLRGFLWRFMDTILRVLCSRPRAVCEWAQGGWAKGWSRSVRTVARRVAAASCDVWRTSGDRVRLSSSERECCDRELPCAHE